MKIQIKPIYSLFVLYSALNYNGYDKENNPEGMCPLRKYVRDYLVRINPEKFNFIYHPYQYTKQVLTTKDFKPTEQTNSDFFDAIEYLSKFEIQTKLKEIWPKVEEEIKKDLVRYDSLIQKVAKAIDQVLDIVRPNTEIVFSVNLLESYYRGYSITLDKFTYIITGPSETPNIDNFIHELIHSYLHDKNFKIKDIGKHPLYRKIPEQLQKNYPPDIIIEESLVRALMAYLSQKTVDVGEGQFTKQDKELIYPELFLEQLYKLTQKELTVEVLEKIVWETLARP